MSSIAAMNVVSDAGIRDRRRDPSSEDRDGGYGHIALVALEGVPESAASGSATGASP
jgi:hypothetical protein